MKKYIYLDLILLICIFIIYINYTDYINNKNTGILFATSKKVSLMNIKIEDKTFTAELERNKTVEALIKKLPLKIKMSELNGNEKYYYLPYSLPEHSEKVVNIKSGDVMLFSDNCIVIFYKSFKTSYKYTKLAHIKNEKDLSLLIENKKEVEVLFTLEGMDK